MRLASFMSFPSHSAGSSFRMHGLIFLMNMTFSILMVSLPLHSAGIFTFIIMSMRLSSFMSFSLHPVLVLVTGMIGMIGMTIYISFISFYMGVIMNYISMMMMGVTMFMNSCVSMSVSISSNMSFSLHPVLVLGTGMIGRMRMTIYISFISFHMGMIMNYISMMMMGVTMFMNSCVGMSVS